MLTDTQLDNLPGGVVALYQDYEDSILRDIARRLAGLDFATSSAAWQMQRLTESGLVFENALKELGQLTGKSSQTLKAMFTKAGVMAVRFDDKIYKAAGMDPLPLNLSPAAGEALIAGIVRTNGFMVNLTLTTAIDGQRSFVAAADLAYVQVSSGAMSYTQAIRAAVKKVGADGISVINYASGHRDQLDVATRRAVLAGVSQTAHDIQWAHADDMGQDLVETSAHAGARPEHALWQGKVFSRSGTSKKYPPFIESTGYGTGAGLGGWGCRHSFFPFWEGISTAIYNDATRAELNDATVEYNGQEISAYDASQIQRDIERQIRYWKREASTLDAAGLDASAEAGNVRDLQARMRDFLKQTDMLRQSEREQI